MLRARSARVLQGATRGSTARDATALSLSHLVSGGWLVGCASHSCVGT
jgi:hypothetical protein